MLQAVTELFSWTWVVSVFAVGVLINLISAYLKPALDNFFSTRSQRLKAKNEAAQRQLEERSSAIAMNPSLLTIEGQRLTSAEIHTMSGFMMFLVALTFGIFAQSSGISTEKKAAVELAVFVCLGMLMVLTLHFMSRETKQNALVAMARKKFEAKNGRDESLQ